MANLDPTAFPRLEPLGDAALLVLFGDGVEEATNRRVHGFCEALRGLGIPEVRSLVPAYASVAVHLCPLDGEAWEAVSLTLLRVAKALEHTDGMEGRLVELPVHYGGEAGPDLGEVATRAGLTPEEVVRRHSAAVYRVHFIGFSPGFPYLGGLDSSLATPRRTTPRTLVPAGSVGIGGAQTGVYPQASPGGWNLIGRTLIPLFDPHGSPPCRLQPGDRVRFLVEEGP